MAQWQKVLKLEQCLQIRVRHLYMHRFPLEVRRCLSDWVEAQDWELAAADEATARTHFHTLLLKLDELVKESLYNSRTLTGPDFSLLQDHLLVQFERSPLDMASRLSECLRGEKLVLDSCEISKQCSPTVTEETQTDLDNKVIQLRNQTQEVVSQIVKSVNLAALIVQTLVSVDLPRWKHKQKMSCVGSPVCTGLERLEKWFSGVAQTLLQIVQQLKKLEEQSRPQISPKLQQINCSTEALLTELMDNALVVEKQPVMYNQTHRPLVLRTNVQFNVKLRFLVNLPILQHGCLIKAEFDEGVEEIKTIQGFRQFQFTSKNTKVMNVSKESGGLVAEWDMSIAEMKSKRKRSNECSIRVTEELHIIKFSTDLQIAGLKCKAETSSLPLVVVSTTSQGPSAWASVLWSNLCPPQDMTLSLFLDPPPLSWDQLSQALSWQFISAGDRELNEDQLNELKLKIVDNQEELVSWSKFSNQKEGPWIWISGILDLIEKRLKNLWRDGCIMGFVSKDNARELLKKKLSGNFLLRFSESNREGAITFSWSEHTKNGVTIHAIDPFTIDELAKESLPDIIKTYRTKRNSNNPLIYLYPDQPKDDAFKRYYSSPSESKKPVIPYLKRIRVCEVDCPTPSSSSPIDIEMDLSPDFTDVPPSPQTDDCNSLLCGLSNKSLQKLQLLQNSTSSLGPHLSTTSPPSSKNYTGFT
ncbi:signal transducer and activator of transcription 1-alpha/beta-like [Periophthalmus magnuspinnatus]|uniref:signal transducer and activator of transcription 1-alpha/beta-like n=1 Tax=Periophthalmus magnuspinnatus TaxID=409849 RepID=UPI002437357F|nr:signal transducer and activator of transcription 1-alpha/beta-like [Periophthalmus magnuspinnatus]